MVVPCLFLKEDELLSLKITTVSLTEIFLGEGTEAILWLISFTFFFFGLSIDILLEMW